METLGLLALAAVFAYLGFDAYGFERTSKHRVWSATPPSRAIGEDPLSLASQEGAQANKYTAIGGIPGLYLVFAVLSLGCIVAAAWLWIK